MNGASNPEKLNDIDYLRDLAERLMHVPVLYGTDQGDCSRLYQIAERLKLEGAGKK
jgi:hypothetical protein